MIAVAADLSRLRRDDGGRSRRRGLPRVAIDRLFGSRGSAVDEGASGPRSTKRGIPSDRKDTPLGRPPASKPAVETAAPEDQQTGEHGRTVDAVPSLPEPTDASPTLPPPPGTPLNDGTATEPPWQHRQADTVEVQDDSAPHFRLPVTTPSLARPSDDEPGVADVGRALREAFTPTQPKKHWNQSFAGRYEIMERIIAAIEEERAHVVIFGERGRGKTSVANVVSEIASDAGYVVLRCACSSDLTFEEIFRSFLRQLPRRYLETGRRGSAEMQVSADDFERLLPEGKFGATEVTNALRYLTSGHAIFVIDEYDRVSDENLKNNLAEAMKNLSDAGANVTLFVIGVARSLEELMGKHPSIQRNVVSIHLPLMTPSEIDRIIGAGVAMSGVRFAQEVRAAIVRLSKGLPYFAQLLCLHAARHAVRDGRTKIDQADLRYAVDRAIEGADNVLRNSFRKAVRGNSTATKEAMFGAADGDCDEFGCFTVDDVRRIPDGPEARHLHVLTLRKALSMLTTEDRGAVLEKVSTPEGLRYRFANQTMRQYVLARRARERGLI